MEPTELQATQREKEGRVGYVFMVLPLLLDRGLSGTRHR